MDRMRDTMLDSAPNPTLSIPPGDVGAIVVIIR